MSGTNLVVDTNILIYLLNGDENIATILDGAFLNVSFITEIEILSSKNFSSGEITQVKQLLTKCTIIQSNPEINAESVNIRKKFGLKTPDAIIAATAAYLQMPLFTADKAFSKLENIEILLYQI